MSALSAEARSYIKGRGLTIAGYTHHWFPDGKWGGDACGCVDDRCSGHHHNAQDSCGCIEPWIDVYVEEANPRVRW